MLLELRGDRPCGHPTLVGKPRLKPPSAGAFFKSWTLFMRLLRSLPLRVSRMSSAIALDVA